MGPRSSGAVHIIRVLFKLACAEQFAVGYIHNWTVASPLRCCPGTELDRAISNRNTSSGQDNFVHGTIHSHAILAGLKGRML
jgi:hypothetical protein